MRRVHGRLLATTSSLALLAGGLFAGMTATPARANVPAVYRVCATVPWKAPSLEQQRRHLNRNSRWSPADRADPGPALEFPFVIQVRSGSISYDQGQLAGLWTLGKRAAKRLDSRCPFVGGPRRNYEVLLKGWHVTRVELTDVGDLIASGQPQAGQVEALHFPGYGNRDGFIDRTITLERADAPGCAISSIEGESGSYGDLFGVGMSCADVLQLQGALDVSFDWTEPVLGFSCAEGDSGYSGQRIACADGTGRTLRFGFSDESF
jgi:hypothetical protein